MLVHGAARAATGNVDEFGGWLDSLGFPLGVAIAWTITTVEIAGGLTLAAGRLVRPLALYFAAQLTAGILLVHGPEGWFVVGLGRNGMEYSVLLVAVFLAQAWSAGEEGAIAG